MAKGQETELMGMYVLSGQILSWLPPAVFTVLNELGFPMAYGLGSLCLYFGAAMLFLRLMGDYDVAVAAMQPGASAASDDFELVAPSPTDEDYRNDHESSLQTPLDKHGALRMS